MVSTGTLKPLTLLPGINKNDAPYSAEGTYVSAQNVRFDHGNPQKIGGFQSAPVSAYYEGVGRDSIAWSDLTGNKFFALGTNIGLYIWNGQTFTDVTPVRLSVAATSVFSAVNGSREISVSINSHGGAALDRFVVAPSINVDGLGISGTYTITSATTNRFTFLAATTASSTVNNDGTATTVSFLISSGRPSSGAVGGWGSGSWGGSGGGWGAGVTSVTADLRTWTLDTWGEDLIANPRSLGIYIWDRTFGLTQRAYVIPNAPTKVNSIAVLSPPRILVAYGTSGYATDFDPLLARWSDQEDYTDWTPTVTNASGELRVQTGNYLQRGITTKNETLVFTDSGLYTQSYIGGNFVYNLIQVGEACGLIGPHAGTENSGIVMWMSQDGFYMYNGVINKMICSVHDNIFSTEFGDGLNMDQAWKVHCATNTEFSEVWWLYPSRNSEENDRYVIYNYERDLWYDGQIVRTTWIDSSTYQRPIATGVSATLFYQESGLNADGVEMNSHLESSLFDIDDGTEVMLIDQFIPDMKDNQGIITVEFGFKKWPESNSITSKGPFRIDSNPVTYMRGRGRQAQVIYRTSGVNNFFQFGKNRIRVRPDGGR